LRVGTTGAALCSAAEGVGHSDHGKLVAQGTPEELKQQTGKDSLEEAFLSLTGSTIRDEAATSADQMRQMAKLWSNRR
jgi:ABC-2 type transport system ATP-binding protein